MAVYSQSIINKCRKHGLTIEQYAFCTLAYSDVSEMDAYIICFRPSSNSQQSIKNALTKEKKKEPVELYLTYLSKIKDHKEQEQLKWELKIRKEIEQEYLSKYQYMAETGQVEQRTEEVKFTAKNRTKEDIIRELNELLERETDSKLKLDYYKQLADLQGMKKEQEKDDEDTIHYYFPITCNQCPLKNENKCESCQLKGE